MARQNEAHYSHKEGEHDVDDDPHAGDSESARAHLPAAFKAAYSDPTHECHADAVALHDQQLQTLRRRVATCGVAEPLRPANLLALGDLYVEVGVFVVVAVAYAALATYSWRKFQTLRMYVRLRRNVRALRARSEAAAAATAAQRRAASAAAATSAAAAKAAVSPARSLSLSPGKAAAPPLSLRTRSPAALPPRGASVTATQARAQISRERIRKNYGFCAHVWRFLSIVVVVAPGLVLIYPAVDMFMSDSPRALVVDARAPTAGDLWAAVKDEWAALSAQRELRDKLGLSGPNCGWGRDGLQACGLPMDSFLLPGVLDIDGLLPAGNAAIATAPVESCRLLLAKAKALAADAQTFPLDPAEVAAAAAAVPPSVLGEYAAWVLSYFQGDDDDGSMTSPSSSFPAQKLPQSPAPPRRSFWDTVHSIGSGALFTVTSAAVDGSQFLLTETLRAAVPTFVADGFAWFAALVKHCAGTVVWWIAVVGYAIAASKVILPMLRRSDPTYARGDIRDELIADWQTVLWAEGSRK